MLKYLTPITPMRMAVAQLNLAVGDLEDNAQKVTACVHQLQGTADVVIFPELTTTGYPPQDLLFENEFVEKNRQTLLKIAENCEIPCIVGFVDSYKGDLYNAAAIVHKGEIHGIQHKMLLPNYDVFDEKRYFAPGKNQSLFEIHGTKVGIEICEDMWDHIYDVHPTETLEKMGADVIINISASPYSVGKVEERLNIARNHMKDKDIVFVYCNLVGGQDELVFDGSSFVLRGFNLIKMGKSFEEDIFVIDTKEEYPEITVKTYKPEELFKALVLGLRDYCRKTHFEKVVLGLSGGIDSSLVASIAVEALGNKNVTALFMPSPYTSQESREDAQVLAENLGITLVTIPIHNIFKSYKDALNSPFAGLPEDTTEENIQARIRGNLLMAFSNKHGYLVLATGNKTEFALGYCTLYGDMAGGLAVIGDVSKHEVYELVRYYNTVRKEPIAERILEKQPSAELKPGQVDPFDYSVVSPLVDQILEKRKSKKDLLNMGYNPELLTDIFTRIRTSEYKRKQAAPVIKVTMKAFGTGRRYPIANQYTDT